ncbi:hypothetical protein DFH09DRAFT_1426764 [Mycena vulgaris]|nr:hypothetical protein DFH09DRAFT_1426764 [Mycena vulgaris]
MASAMKSPAHLSATATATTSSSSDVRLRPSGASSTEFRAESHCCPLQLHETSQAAGADPTTCKALGQTSTTSQVGFKSGSFVFLFSLGHSKLTLFLFSQFVPPTETTFSTFTVSITNDTAPIWGYCGQEAHCAAEWCSPSTPQQLRCAPEASKELWYERVMDAPDSDLQGMHDDMLMVFGYEPEDDADEWWMTWGRFRDSNTAEKQNSSIDWGFPSLTSYENHDSDS